MGENRKLMRKFRAAAMEFINVVDAASQTETNAFLLIVGRCVAEIYSIALLPPPVELDSTGTDEPPFQTEKWETLRRSLQEKFGPWRVIDSTSKEELVARESRRGHLRDLFRPQGQP